MKRRLASHTSIADRATTNSVGWSRPLFFLSLFLSFSSANAVPQERTNPHSAIAYTVNTNKCEPKNNIITIKKWTLERH